MRPRILPLALLSLYLVQTLAHQCILRDTPNQPPTTLPDNRINDDYCDCQDGSDEPATPACPNGTFVCVNAAHRPKRIPSAWVRDGACDCCDGSDERPGKCPDNCADIRKREMADAKARAEVVMRGVKTRATYVKHVADAVETDNKELRKLERELAAVERALNKSKNRADGLRRRRAWQTAPPVVEKSHPVSSHSADDGDSAKSDHAHDDHHDHYDYDYEDNKEGENVEKSDDEMKTADRENREEEDDLDDDLIAQEEEEDLHDDEDDDDFKDDDIDDDEDDEEDYSEFYDDIDEHEVTSSNKVDKEGETKEEDESKASAENPSQSSVSAPEPESEREVEPEPTLDVDSVCADLETASANRAIRLFSYMQAILLTKLNRILPNLFPVKPGSAISGLNECIRQADSAKWKLESQKNELEEKIKKLRKKQTTDYGSDKALRKLHGECTKSKVMQYEFEHCAFDLVKQYEHGSAIATLGRFDGWETDGDERYMKYTNGDGCWNGPSRSIKVQLLCGEKEDIVSVDEPNRCTYFMKFKTPAVCEKEMADSIMSAFSKDSEQKDEL